MLSPDTAEWAMRKPGGVSATIRNCLEMQRAAEQQRE
jgi:hypothetical protein